MYQHFKCIIQQTNQVGYLGGTILQLMNINAIECLPKQAITYFQLKYNYSTDQIYYEYNCEEFPWINETVYYTKYTNPTFWFYDYLNVLYFDQ